jgi:cation transport ATPase
MRVIHRNIVFSLAYNLLGVALAMAGVITPLIAAIMMPASSLTVVLGSWLGKTFDPPAPSVASNESERATMGASMEAAA